MTIQTEGCRVCSSPNAEPWAEENGFFAVKCNECSLVYLSPWPDLSDRDRSLQQGAHAGDKVIDTNARPSGKGLVREYRNIINGLYGDALSTQDVNWLDIGCGYGEFLIALKPCVGEGSSLRGSEPNSRKAEYARSQGLDVGYSELDSSNGTFTHISFLNVFSHLPRPIDFLSQTRDLLVPGGELLIQTGNSGDLERKDVPGELWFPDHLIFGGHRSLEVVFEKLGMNVISTAAYRSPNLTPVNVAKDLVKRVVRPNHNPINWRGPYRSIWVRAKKS